MKSFLEKLRTLPLVLFFAAATVAGVMTREDALSLVTLRGRIFERLPEGGMLSIDADADSLEPMLAELDKRGVGGLGRQGLRLEISAEIGNVLGRQRGGEARH